MAVCSAEFDSPYYPYKKDAAGYNSYRGADDIPLRIRDYLLDLPDAKGYAPQDNNDFPRVRLMKYLCYDGADPLSKPLPSPEIKRSLVFDANKPAVNTDEEKRKHPLGYRIFPMQYWLPADFKANTLLKFYMGRELPYSPHVSQISIVFEIVVNYMQENNLRTDAVSRLWAMENALKGALHGVNIGGIGVLTYDRRENMDAGSHPFKDEGTNIGREVCFSLTWAES